MQVVFLVCLQLVHEDATVKVKNTTKSVTLWESAVTEVEACLNVHIWRENYITDAVIQQHRRANSVKAYTSERKWHWPAQWQHCTLFHGEKVTWAHCLSPLRKQRTKQETSQSLPWENRKQTTMRGYVTTISKQQRATCKLSENEGVFTRARCGRSECTPLKTGSGWALSGSSKHYRRACITAGSFQWDSSIQRTRWWVSNITESYQSSICRTKFDWKVLLETAPSDSHLKTHQCHEGRWKRIWLFAESNTSHMTIPLTCLFMTHARPTSVAGAQRLLYVKSLAPTMLSPLPHTSGNLWGQKRVNKTLLNWYPQLKLENKGCVQHFKYMTRRT